MSRTTSNVRAWLPGDGCACMSCDLCAHDEPEAIATSRPAERAPEPRPVRQVSSQRDAIVAAQEAVFAALEVY